MKAFQVQDQYEGNCVIVYAEKNVVARRVGSSELGADFPDVSCCRAPWADQFYPNGPTRQQGVELGDWWVECACWCYRRIDNDGGYAGPQNDSEANPMAPVYVEDRVYWNQACLDADTLRKQAEAAALAMDQAQAEKQVLAAYPFATEIKAYRGYAQGLDGKYGYDVLQCHFRFPGGEGGAHWTLGSENIRVRQDDSAAWDALVAGASQ